MACRPRLDQWRISGLNTLSRCPGLNLLQRGSESGKAAATGSMVGRLVELFHRADEDTGRVDDVVRQAKAEVPDQFPKADVDAAVTTALMYMQDPRQRGEVVSDLREWGNVPEGADPHSCEFVVRANLDPAPEDPTGEVVKLKGHVDQIRAVGGQLYVWDVKNGQPSGREMLPSYAFQLSAYAVAATETLGVDVLPGGIIRTQGYGATRRVRGDDGELRERGPTDYRVFYHAGWSLETCREMLGTAVQHIALIRAGIVLTQPGGHCSWCPGEGPQACGRLIEDLFK